jgi:hypothetical protein
MPTAVSLFPPTSLTGSNIVRQLILADKYERYELTYEGCHVFNPGSFVGTTFGFSTYFPARARSEASCVVFSLVFHPLTWNCFSRAAVLLTDVIALSSAKRRVKLLYRPHYDTQVSIPVAS